MTMEGKIFSSKILLFGEYLLLCGAKALSIPFKKYSGHFTYSAQPTESNKSLVKFLDYLKTINEQIKLNLTAFETDIRQGLTFQSNIPHGYGLGSSGSLSAAVYDRYAVDKIPNTTTSKAQIKELKTLFGLMESFFHGKSSGLDPLISYLKEPVLVEGADSIHKVALPHLSENPVSVFLLDYGQSGDTGPLVQEFISRCANDPFKKRIEKEMIPVNNQCIDHFLEGNLTGCLPCVKQLSAYTAELFQKMIPKNLLDAWMHGIKSDDYYLKLCGSGGGGMVLGFTHDLEKAKKLLKPYPIETVF